MASPRLAKPLAETCKDIGGSAWCYACDARATGVRDRRPEGGRVEPACPRHTDHRVPFRIVCSLCLGPARKGSVVNDDDVTHAKCYRESAGER